MEAIQDVDQQLCVVVFASHQVSAAKVDPFELWKPFAELFFDMSERALENIGSTLAMAVAMESFYIFW